MTRFTPPYPQPMRARHPWLRWLESPWKFFRSRHCAIASVIDKAYTMQLGEYRLPGRTMYIANQPDLVRRVLVEDADHFPKDVVIADMLGLLMGDSIFVSNGAVWRRQRRMMDPAFESARIRAVFGLMRDAVDDMLARLDSECGKPEAPIDVEMTHVTADIIFRTLFSERLSAPEAHRIYDAFVRFQELAYTHGMMKAIGVPDLLLKRGYHKAGLAAAEIRGILDPIVAARYERFHSRGCGAPQEKSDILEALISVVDPEGGGHFALGELCEQVAMLFLAGHETSATTLAWALYLLAMDGDVQERLHREAVTVLGDRPPAFADMRRLTLARNVLAEALRLYPPVAFLPRRATRDCPLRDKHVPAGAVVSVSPWLLHRHRRHWRDPDVFDPDRFDREETAEAQRQAYLPFSRGPRVCLGAAFALQEGILILAAIARRFRLEPVPGFVPRAVGRLTVRSENGMRIKVTRR